MQFQPVPLIAVAVRPAGRESVTVTRPVEASGPLLVTESVYSAPVWPCRKSPVWDLLMTRLVERTVVESSSVLGVGSPPPETVELLTSGDGALFATSTVRVMSG